MSRKYESALKNPTLDILRVEDDAAAEAQATAGKEEAPVVYDESLMKNFTEPVRKTRCKRVQILITNEMYSKVKATATAGKVSVNEIVNQALYHYYS